MVADADDRPLPVGETGEIICRGDVVMPGYWRNREANAETMRGGWLHTGDVGAFDADGYLTLKDRSKDLIISGGSNIYPREVEEVLLTHGRVREVSVIGRPDREWGEVVVAYVVGEAARAELDALCLNAIARFKRPKDYVFVDALPKNNYGKILKTELRASTRGAATRLPPPAPPLPRLALFRSSGSLARRTGPAWLAPPSSLPLLGRVGGGACPVAALVFPPGGGPFFPPG